MIKINPFIVLHVPNLGGNLNLLIKMKDIQLLKKKIQSKKIYSNIDSQMITINVSRPKYRILKSKNLLKPIKKDKHRYN